MATAALMAMLPDVIVVRLIVSARVPLTAASIVRSPVTAVRLIDFPSVLSCTSPDVVRFPVLVTEMSPPVSLIAVTVSVAAALTRLTSPLVVFVAWKLETALVAVLRSVPVVDEVVNRPPVITAALV